MALSPQRIRDITFKPARKGYDQGEVDTFLRRSGGHTRVGAERGDGDGGTGARRRRPAAGADPGPGAEAPAAAREEVRGHVDEAETISRTLLLAQRTADQTVADAQAEADRLLATARDEAASRLDGAREEATQLVEEGKAEARRAGESERVRVEGEVQALLARRDFLESDVDHLEQYIVAQRERITEAVSDLHRPGRAHSRRAGRHAPAVAVGGRRRAADGDEAAAPDVDGDVDQERSEISEITRVAEGAADSVDDDVELPPADAQPDTATRSTVAAPLGIRTHAAGPSPAAAIAVATATTRRSPPSLRKNGALTPQ